MTVIETTKNSRHPWAVWAYILGFLGIIVETILAAYAPERPGVVLVGIAAALVYAAVGWTVM